MSPKTSLAYRTDIDGLRAVSMLTILIFHLEFPILPGGFAAVDLFFVISGYVITRIIYKNMVEKSFSLKDFYARRVCRLLPAMAVMLIATLLMSGFLLPPASFLELSTSVAAVIFFMANVFFWYSSDYFSVAAELKPLLHCWTLSVEEQLYIFFPLLLYWAASRSRTAAISVVLVTTLLSFLLCIFLTSYNEPAAFYLMPSRAWEFLLGAIVALGVLPKLNSQFIRELLTVCGMLLIATAFLFMDESMPFPGYYALWPSLGCMLVIYGGNYGECRSAAILQFAPLRYIGRISYSLYLWHWPLIAIANNIIQGDLSLVQKLSLAGLSIALGSISYHYVEQPFRRNKRVMQWLSIKKGAVIASFVALAGGAGYAYTMNSDYGRYLRLAEESKAYANYPQPCRFDQPGKVVLSECSFGDLESDKTFMVWGDSHAMVMMPAFITAAKTQGWRGIWGGRPGCPPLFGVYRLDGVSNASACTVESGEKVRAFLVEQPVDMLFLTSRWSIFEFGYMKNGRLQSATHFLSDDKAQGYDAATSKEVLERSIYSTVGQFATELNLNTVIVGAIPVLPKNISEFSPRDLVLIRENYDKQKKMSAEIFTDLEQRYNNVSWIDPTRHFCTAYACMAFDGDTPLYHDDNHVSLHGALKLVGEIERALATSKQK